MRQWLRILGWTFWSLLSLDIAVGILDWLPRWEWMKQFMMSHRSIDKFAHTPFVFLLLLILGFAFVMAERRLKQPKIAARYLNARIIPDRHTTTIGDYFANQEKKPGWDEKRFNWQWLVEVQFANDADIPTSIEEIEIRAWIPRKKWQRKTQVTARHEPDVSQYTMDMSRDAHCEEHSFTCEQYRKVDGLMDKIRNVPLARGIGYRGWLRFYIEQVNQRDVQKLKLDVWLVDALQGRHKVHYNKKSQKRWDQSFFIFEDT